LRFNSLSVAPERFPSSAALDVLVSSFDDPIAPPLARGEEFAGAAALGRMAGPDRNVRGVFRVGNGITSVVPFFAPMPLFSRLDDYLSAVSGTRSHPLSIEDSLGVGGKGWSARQALGSCLGEAAERFAASMFGWGRADAVMTLGEAISTGATTLSLTDLNLFSPEQWRGVRFPYRPLTHDSQLTWFAGRSVLDDQPVLVPSQLCCLLSPLAPAEDLFIYSTSVGTAAGSSRDDAAVGGLLEVIERDAMNLRWFSGVRGANVPIKGDFVTFLRAQGWRVGAEVLWTDVDGVSVVFAFAAHESAEELGWVCGSAGGLTFDEALSGAIRELAQSWAAVETIRSMAHGSEQDRVRFRSLHVESPDDVESVHETFAYHGRSARRAALVTEFFDPHPVPLPAQPTRGPVGNRLEEVKSILERNGLGAIVVDLTPRRNEGSPSLTVVKCLIPGLTYPSIGRHCALGHRRFEAVSRLREAMPPERWAERYGPPVPFP
jgi:ribosomal protein S12 methylthiotransferase accessory factor